MARTETLVSRNEKGSTPLGSATFIALRLLDPFLQYGLLIHGWGDPLIRLLGGRPLPLEGPVLVLGLPYWRLSIFAMAVAGCAKTIFYLVYVSRMAMPVRAAVFVGFFKLFSTTVNTLLFCTTATSAASAFLSARSVEPDTIPLPPVLLVASWAVFVVGMAIENVAELQRKAFKDDPRNKGKPFTGGLFSAARHINYGGYAIWKSAAAMAACGYWWGGLTLAWLIAEFRRRVIPEIDAYCTERYGAGWVNFKNTTRYKMIPYIY
ncbi:Uu.00g140340.m01.CDS01 [Anthostomella pinea]|uniref:Uu.00g140340.m01.CDS01 n=1 Tax=Anthostomella pinea TaxID=933095 RepID=A0AAI8VQ27_9PEZI|nr:Uu.00g140340.m01.CDS01 [Anthostomella pinea]